MSLIVNGSPSPPLHRSAHLPAGPAARPSPAHRHQEGLQPGRVRRLHHPGGWRAHLSCLALAVQYDGASITTVEGLAGADGMHPLQHAFIEHDGYQCGYCTPGQICSAVAWPPNSAAACPAPSPADLESGAIHPTREELQERMSGNLCRCGAHNGIVDAITETFAKRPAFAEAAE